MHIRDVRPRCRLSHDWPSLRRLSNELTDPPAVRPRRAASASATASRAPSRMRATTTPLGRRAPCSPSTTASQRTRRRWCRAGSGAARRAVSRTRSASTRAARCSRTATSTGWSATWRCSPRGRASTRAARTAASRVSPSHLSPLHQLTPLCAGTRCLTRLVRRQSAGGDGWEAASQPPHAPRHVHDMPVTRPGLGPQAVDHHTRKRRACAAPDSEEDDE